MDDLGRAGAHVISQSKEVVERLAYAPTKTAQMPPNPPAMKDFAFSTTTDAPELVPAVAWSDESPLCIYTYFLETEEQVQ
jgi:hypothetical protein